MDEQYKAQLEQILSVMADELGRAKAELDLMREAAERANALANVRVRADYMPAENDDNTGFYL